MKHIINKITSNSALFLVLITLFTISNNHKIKYHSYGSAIELTYIDDQDSINYFKTSSNPTMYTYFNNLNTCYGQNRCGTCSYIAMGMLLSYYDTFYDDYFIAENFDYQETPSSINYILDNSPGVRREDYTGLSDTITDYTNYFINHSSTHFMSYLLTLCMNSPINYYNQYNILFNTDYYSMIGALDFGQINSILNYYINMRGLNNSYSVTNQTINFSNITYPLQNSSVINFIINNLNNGYPVLVCTQPEYSVGHTQIVYSYTYT